MGGRTRNVYDKIPLLQGLHAIVRKGVAPYSREENWTNEKTSALRNIQD